MARYLALLVLMAVACTARAHDVPTGFVILDVGHGTVDVELHAPVSEMATALSAPSSITPDDLIRQAAPRIERYVMEYLHLSTPTGQRYTAQIQSLSTRPATTTSAARIVITTRMSPPQGASTDRFTLEYDATHPPPLALVEIRRDIRTGMLGDDRRIVGVIGFPKTRLDVDNSQGSWWQGFTRLFSLGVGHIAEGIDHLLFLLVLLLPAPLLASHGRWSGGKSVRASAWTIGKTVSGFTIGHSLTLALGSMGWASVPTQPIEVLIACSIIVSAIHAWKPLFAGREIWLASGFGLIHGLAFANTLTGLSFDAWTLGISLLGFNLGIEAMQLLVVAPVLPVLILLSRTPAYGAVRVAGAAFAAVCALGWIGERGLHLPNPMTPIVDHITMPSPWVLAAASLAACTVLGLWRRQDARSKLNESAS